MSLHKIPLTKIEEDGLRAHGLDIGTPSQLSDAFRHGVAWALKAGQGEAVAYVKPDSPIKGHTEFCRHETWMIDEGENIMIAGGWFPLYLSATADAVSVPRELLERLIAADDETQYESSAESTMDAFSRLDSAWTELRALLARQEVKS